MNQAFGKEGNHLKRNRIAMAWLIFLFPQEVELGYTSSQQDSRGFSFSQQVTSSVVTDKK